MQVTNTLKVYDIDNNDKTDYSEFVQITSHWNRTDLVYLKFDNKIVALSAQELIKAVNNATNY